MRTKYIIIAILGIICNLSLSAQSIHIPQNEAVIANFSLYEDDTLRYANHYLYEHAYRTIEDMLTDKQPVSFKDAVFAVENALLDGGGNYQAFDYKIGLIANNVLYDVKQLRSSMPSDATAKNLAITLFFAENRISNNYQRCTYDLQSLYNDGGIVGGLVLSLLQNWKGTCRSMPYLFKIIADEIGAPSYIACAPMHFYIKHQDNVGTWRCYETTRYAYLEEQHIYELNHISPTAVQSGLYAKPLTDKEALCLCLYDLCYFYEKKTGFYSNAFVRKCYQLGLRYNPVSILRALEINDLKYQLDKELWNLGGRSESDYLRFPDLNKRYQQLQQLRRDYDALGHYEYTQTQIKDKIQLIKDYDEKNMLPK